MKTLAALALALSTVAALGSTTLVTSDPHTGTTTTFTDTGNNGFNNPGPVTLDGFSVTGNPQATYGNSPYLLSSNGSWTQSWIATNNGSGSITFNLGGDYGLVGAFINYSPNSGSDPTITALASDGTTVLGTYDIASLDPISTPGAVNAGDFVGIQSSTSNIAFLELSGSFILAHSLEVGAPAVSATPEPSSLFLLGTGLLGAGVATKKRLVSRLR